ncbi:MAG: hypothetical protein WKF30_17150 [Pyrinomonadaceae bacterium]
MASEAFGTKGVLPPFNSKGRLPYGVHRATWKEFRRRFVFSSRRAELLEGLLRAVSYLRQARCPTIYIGGSFATTKFAPRDLDVVWQSETTDWRYLAQIAPVFFEMTPGNPRQKRLFGGEFFPSEGIETESGLTFLEFFQRDYEKGRRRGVVELDIRRVKGVKR